VVETVLPPWPRSHGRDGFYCPSDRPTLTFRRTDSQSVLHTNHSQASRTAAQFRIHSTFIDISHCRHGTVASCRSNETKPLPKGMPDTRNLITDQELGRLRQTTSCRHGVSPMLARPCRRVSTPRKYRHAISPMLARPCRRVSTLWAPEACLCAVRERLSGPPV
jgi:hypothetical protein